MAKLAYLILKFLVWHHQHISIILMNKWFSNMIAYHLPYSKLELNVNTRIHIVIAVQFMSEWN